MTARRYCSRVPASAALPELAAASVAGMPAGAWGAGLLWTGASTDAGETAALVAAGAGSGCGAGTASAGAAFRDAGVGVAKGLVNAGRGAEAGSGGGASLGGGGGTGARGAA